MSGLFVVKQGINRLTPAVFTSAGLDAVLKFLMAVLLVGLTACSGGDGRKTGPPDSSPASEDITPKPGEKDCYNFMVDNDTVVITIKWLDTSRFTGSMLYQLKEKDRNIGSLEGIRKGDLLLADYEFSSEGMQSKRQVAFKRIQDYLVEGYGEVWSDSSGFKFREPGLLNFDLNRKIYAVRCL